MFRIELPNRVLFYFCEISPNYENENEKKKKKSSNLHKGFSFQKIEKTQEKNKGLGPGFLKFRAHDPVDHQTALEIPKKK